MSFIGSDDGAGTLATASTKQDEDYTSAWKTAARLVWLRS